MLCVREVERGCILVLLLLSNGEAAGLWLALSEEDYEEQTGRERMERKTFVTDRLISGICALIMYLCKKKKLFNMFYGDMSQFESVEEFYLTSLAGNCESVEKSCV